MKNRMTTSTSFGRRGRLASGPWASGVCASLLVALTPAPGLTQPAPTPAPKAAAASASAAVEPLQAVFVVGRAGLSAQQIQAAVAPLYGQPLNAALVERVRLAVAAAHDAAGHRLVTVDPPVIQGAILLVRVHALRVARVTVQSTGGNDAASEALTAAALAALPALREGETPDLDQVDRQLRLANLQPHRRWAVDFRAAQSDAPPPAPPREAGSFDSRPTQSVASARETPPAQAPLALPRLPQRNEPPPLEARVLAEGAGPWYGRLMLDNAGQQATGRERLRVQVGHGDLFGAGRSLDLTALASISHPDRQHQLALRHQHPLPSWNSLLSMELQASRSRPGKVGEYFDVAGSSDGGNVSLRHLLARRGGLEPYVEIGLEQSVHEDVIEFYGTNVGGRVGMVPLVLTLGATWQDGPWRAFGQTQLRHNTGWGPHASSADYTRARADAPVHWTSLNMAAELRRSMSAGQEWVVRAQGQWTDDALVPAQQMRTGGSTLVRGLDESELSGDRGLALAAEYWWPLGSGHRLGLMVDAAALHRIAPQAGESRSASAVTASVGWQWQPEKGPRLSATLGHVLRARHLPASRRGDSRLHVLLDWPL